MQEESPAKRAWSARMALWSILLAGVLLLSAWAVPHVKLHVHRLCYRRGWAKRPPEDWEKVRGAALRLARGADAQEVERLLGQPDIWGYALPERWGTNSYQLDISPTARADYGLDPVVYSQEDTLPGFIPNPYSWVYTKTGPRGIDDEEAIFVVYRKGRVSQVLLAHLGSIYM